MSSVNPVILIQLLMQYHYAKSGLKGARTFAFTKNNRLRVHKETDDEVMRRKTYIDGVRAELAEKSLRTLLNESLNNRIGTVWIDPAMKNIAVPLAMSASQNGFGILPTGSRVDIPQRKFIRAFTYWEKVNDIDLSCFAITENGEKEEFSWRNMYGKQGADIAYSGDQTSGYNGGSEYFDIDIDQFKENHPGYRYVVFCNNVYIDIPFNKIECRAGFMTRDAEASKTPVWKGEANMIRYGKNYDESAPIFDPKTVQTSFRIDADSIFAYLFAIDLEKRQMVWLNMARSDRRTVAGTTDMDFLLRYLTITDVLNVYDLYYMACSRMTTDLTEADVIVCDSVPNDWPEKGEVIHSWDFEKMLRLLQPA